MWRLQFFFFDEQEDGRTFADGIRWEAGASIEKEEIVTGEDGSSQTSTSCDVDELEKEKKKREALLQKKHTLLEKKKREYEEKKRQMSKQTWDQ